MCGNEKTEIYDLTVRHMKEPLGLDERPYFSWKIRSSGQEVFQSAYRITVESADGTSVWDSGKVKSDISCYVDYEGEKLRSQIEYIWKVTVWDNRENHAEKSAGFEMGLLEPKDWKAHWVETPYPAEKREKIYGKQPPATMFQKRFTIKEKKISRARLYATCRGVYRVYVNGRRPDDREFAPENTSYPMMTCYQIYDVTFLLRPGENTLELYVGDGWYCCPNYRREGMKEEPQHAALFQLFVEYEDAETQTEISDRDVKAA